MAVDGRRLNNAGEILGEVSIGKALKARAELRQQERRMALAALRAGDDAPWIVLTTANRSEFLVDKLLEEFGVERWLPLKKGEPKRRGCRPVVTSKAVLVPAFPGYLFVRVNPSDDVVQGLLRLDHVSGIMGQASGKPEPVGWQIVKKLRKMVDDGELDRTVEARRLKKGDKVIVKDGPLAWEEGRVDWIERAKEGYAGTLHVRVLFAIFGRAVPVQLRLDQIVKSD